MLCLGLDIGSSTIKGAVLDLESGSIPSIVKEPFPDPVAGLPTGWFEVDPGEVVARTRLVISQLIMLAPDARSLFLCGQMGGAVLVDRHNSPRTRYLSWRDQRTLAGALEQVRSRLAPFLPQLGNELKPGSMTSLLSWLRQAGELEADWRPSTVGDFVISQLTGTLPRMEGTQAIGLVDLQLRGWNMQAFGSLGLDQLDWGEMSNATTPVAHCTIDGRELAVYPTLGDQQCALRGVGLRVGDLSINVSTGSQVSLVTSEFTPGPYQSRDFFDGTFLNTITHVPAGRALNVLVDLLTALPAARGLTVPNPWEVISREAATAPDGTDGLRVHPAFFDSPIGREGQITGITTENLRIGHLFRATFESMADTYDQLANRLWPTRGWNRVVVSGGLTRAVPILRELIEQRFPGQIVETTADEETLLGLLEIARQAHSGGRV
jgi:sugar (pentulose or hexulose) kinase